MSEIDLLDRAPPEQRDRIKREIGAPTDAIPPKLKEPVAGILVGLLVLGGGIVQIVLSLQMAENKLWCLAGIGLLAASFAILAWCIAWLRNAPHLLLGPNGFAIASRNDLIMCRWSQIMEVRTDDVEYQEKAMPFFKGPLGKITYTRVDRSYRVMDKDGRTHCLEASAYKGLRRFRERCEQECSSRGIPWHYEKTVLDE